MQSIEDFQKFEIKIGTIKSAEKASNSDKLLKLIFDFGSEERQIITAMAVHFPDPKVLVGKQIPVLLNIEPKVFRGNESQGMIVASDNNGKPVFLVPEEEVPNGTPII